MYPHSRNRVKKIYNTQEYPYKSLWRRLNSIWSMNPTFLRWIQNLPNSYQFDYTYSILTGEPAYNAPLFLIRYTYPACGMWSFGMCYVTLHAVFSIIVHSSCHNSLSLFERTTVTLLGPLTSRSDEPSSPLFLWELPAPSRLGLILPISYLSPGIVCRRSQWEYMTILSAEGVAETTQRWHSIAFVSRHLVLT